MVKLSFLTSILSFTTCTLAGSNAFYGLDYGVNTDNCPTLETLKIDFRILSQYTNTIRIYSVKDCNLGELDLKASQANKLRLYLELAALQTIAKSESFRNVDAIIVGSEVMYRGDIPSDQLVNHIEKVKTLAHPFGTMVTTSEVYYKFFPDVIQAVDFLMMNALIYCEGGNVVDAADLLLQHYDHVKSISNGKEVRISETGWPDIGAINLNSTPSPENQNEFMLAALYKTKERGIDIIWFSAIDKEYKTGVEGHFGLLDINRQLKGSFRFEKIMNPC